MANLQVPVAGLQYSVPSLESRKVYCNSSSDLRPLAPGITAGCEQVCVHFGARYGQLFPQWSKLRRNHTGKVLMPRYFYATQRDYHGTIRSHSENIEGVRADRRDEFGYLSSESGDTSGPAVSSSGRELQDSRGTNSQSIRQTKFVPQHFTGDRRNGSSGSSFDSERSRNTKRSIQNYSQSGRDRRYSEAQSGTSRGYAQNGADRRLSQGDNDSRSKEDGNGRGYGRGGRDQGYSIQNYSRAGWDRRSSEAQSDTSRGYAQKGADRRLSQGGNDLGSKEDGNGRGYGRGGRDEGSGRGSVDRRRSVGSESIRSSSETNKISQGRGQAQRKDRATNRSSSNPTPNPMTQTVTPREASPFVSNRQVHRAPWEQGGSSSNSGNSVGWKDSAERNFRSRNPLIERLQREVEEAESGDSGDDDDVDDIRENENASRRDSDDEEDSRFQRGNSKSAMARIAEKLGNISAGQSPYEPRDRNDVRLPEGQNSTVWQPRSKNTRERDWARLTTPHETVARKNLPDTRFPWERADDAAGSEAAPKEIRVKPPSLAELTLPDDELRRLRSLGILTRHRIKVGRLGVTNGIVESIHNEWRNSEVVRIKCEGPPAQNMRQTHEALEQRTRGLVVWRAGGACLVYRGKDYVPPPVKEFLDVSDASVALPPAAAAEAEDGETDGLEGSTQRATTAATPKVMVPRMNSVYDPDLEKEMEEILTSLGTRYDDWTGMRPVPVDADLLAGPYAKYKKPFRLLPYGVRRTLTNVEMTNLRRLARPIPPHFVLGLNRGLEGLAAAIIKLWEKSEIAKISVKRGVQNTSHERMGEQLKRLTGGVLLARDKFFIVLYRGKDFLPTAVSAALEERQRLASTLLEAEESLRCLPRKQGASDASVALKYAGTLAETLDMEAKWSQIRDSDAGRKSREEAKETQRRDMARRIQRKIYTTNLKKAKAAVDLQKVEKRLRPAGPPVDRENITDEERHMFSKLGLKMHAFLLLGRRGIFGGTVENMHLHWKHRELVKIIYKATDRIDLEQTARMLEYESGGILVATIPTNKGQAIIVYRGKNYQRPPQLRPPSLLTKRQALKRSIEMQRQQALTKHLLALEQQIETLQSDLTKLEDDENHVTVREAEGDSDEDDDEGSQREWSEVITGLATAINIHFQTHAMVKVGLKVRESGTSAAKILNQLEVATGAEVVFQEASTAILYRGWPDGQERPTDGFQLWDDHPPELQDAMMSAVKDDEDYLHESDWEDSEGDDANEWDDDESDYDDVEEEEDGEDEKFRQTRSGPKKLGANSVLSMWDDFEDDKGGGTADEFDEHLGHEESADEFEGGDFDLNRYEAKLSRNKSKLDVNDNDGIESQENQKEDVLTELAFEDISR